MRTLAVCACGLLVAACAPDARSAVLALAATAALIAAVVSVSEDAAAVRTPHERFASGTDAARAVRAIFRGSSAASGAGAVLRDLDAACVAYCKAITCERGGPRAATHVSDYQLSRGAVLSGLAGAEVGNLRGARDRPAAVDSAVRPVLALFGDFDAVLLERGLSHRRGPDPATASRSGAPFGSSPGS